jgi:hypothetical protein
MPIFLLSFKEQDFSDALTRAAGVVVDPLSDVETMVPGGSLVVSVRTFDPKWTAVTIAKATVTAPAGWTIDGSHCGRRPRCRPGPGRPPRGADPGDAYRVTLAADAPPTQPYHMERPRQGDSYQWGDSLPYGLPFAPH